MDIFLTIEQEVVYEQVKIASSYTGAKLEANGSAYKHISATDADIDTALGRFWNEAESEATQLFKPFVKMIEHETSSPKDGSMKSAYVVTLTMPSNFDENLTGSMEVSLRSFFVESLTAAWFRYCNRGDVEKYEASAAAALNDVRQKLYYRKKPARPTIVVAGS